MKNNNNRRVVEEETKQSLIQRGPCFATTKQKLNIFENMMHNWISCNTQIPVSKNGSSDKLLLSDRVAMLKNLQATSWADSNFDEYSRARREMSNNVFGAQEYRVKMHSIIQPVTTAVGGILTSVFGMAYNGLANQASFASAFDEVRFEANGHQFNYYPQLNASGANSNLLAVGVVDYDDASAISSTNNALQYDTARLFNIGCNPATADAEESKVHWDVHLKGQPDTVWQSTASATLGVAYLKMYNVTPSLASSTTFGYVIYTSTVLFRQAN
jgi:hypothetical protein